MLNLLPDSIAHSSWPQYFRGRLPGLGSYQLSLAPEPIVPCPPFLFPALEEVAASTGDTSLGHLTFPSLSPQLVLCNLFAVIFLNIRHWFFFRLVPDQLPPFPVSSFVYSCLGADSSDASPCSAAPKWTGIDAVFITVRNTWRKITKLWRYKGKQREWHRDYKGWWMKTDKVIRTIHSRKTECERRYHLSLWNESCGESRMYLSTLAGMHGLTG